MDTRLKEARRQAERAVIIEALQQTGGHAGKAMVLLGVSRASFYRLLKASGLQITRTAIPVVMEG